MMRWTARTTIGTAAEGRATRRSDHALNRTGRGTGRLGGLCAASPPPAVATSAPEQPAKRHPEGAEMPWSFRARASAAALVLSRLAAYMLGAAAVRIRRKPMDSATFQKWLADHGCRFEAAREKRGTGHATVTVHREGRRAEVQLGGPHQTLDARIVRRACEELGLDWSELPGPKSRV